MINSLNQFAIYTIVFFTIVLSPLAFSAEELSVSLESDSNSVLFNLTNNTDEDLSVLVWETPLEPELSQDVFDVVASVHGKPYRYGRRAQYLGRLFKRAQPQWRNYWLIKAGETVTRNIDISQFYRLDADGRYSVRFVGEFNFLPAGLTARMATGARVNEQTVQVSSEQVMVNLQASKLVARARAGEFESCTASQQSEIEDDFNASEDITREALAALQGLPENERPGSPRYLQWFGLFEPTRYSRVVATYQNALARMDDGAVDFNCGCNEEVFAFVFPSRPFEVFLCNVYWRVNQTGTDSRAGTILHELSHFPQIGDTSDFAYGQTVASGLARTNPDNAVINADSIEYFAENTPFIEISAGETTPLQLVEYTPLPLATAVSADVVEGESLIYQVSGADFIELTTIDGDTDLFVYSTPNREDQLCVSESVGSAEVCELSGLSTAYIEVVGIEDSSFDLLAVPVETPELVSEELILNETLSFTIEQDGEQFFTVSGANRIVLNSLSGDADLYLFSDPARRNLICVANAFSSESVLDACEASLDTVYVIVYGYRRSDYTIVAESFDSTIAELSDDSVDIPVVVTEQPLVSPEPVSVDTDSSVAELDEPVATNEDELVSGDNTGDSGGGSSGDGSGGGAGAGLWLFSISFLLLIFRRRKMVNLGAR